MIHIVMKGNEGLAAGESSAEELSIVTCIVVLDVEYQANMQCSQKALSMNDFSPFQGSLCALHLSAVGSVKRAVPVCHNREEATKQNKNLTRRGRSAVVLH